MRGRRFGPDGPDEPDDLLQQFVIERLDPGSTVGRDIWTAAFDRSSDDDGVTQVLCTQLLYFVRDLCKGGRNEFAAVRRQTLDVLSKASPEDLWRAHQGRRACYGLPTWRDQVPPPEVLDTTWEQVLCGRRHEIPVIVRRKHSTEDGVRTWSYCASDLLRGIRALLAVAARRAGAEHLFRGLRESRAVALDRLRDVAPCSVPVSPGQVPDLAHRLGAVLVDVPPPRRAAFATLLADGPHYEEVANAFACSVPSVFTWRKQVAAQLRQALEDLDEEERAILCDLLNLALKSDRFLTSLPPEWIDR